MEKYDRYISLGYICSVPAMISSLKLKRRSCVFDLMASPAWAIKELFDNDFDELLDNIEFKKLFDNSEEIFTVDTKYYLRLLPKSLDQIPKYKNIIVKFAERLMLYLATTTDKVLFIRQSETHTYSDKGTRISDELYAERYEKTETFWMESLSVILKNKYPNLKFKILLMSDDGNFWDDDNNLVGIQKADCDYRNLSIGPTMAKNIKAKKDFLEDHL